MNHLYTRSLCNLDDIDTGKRWTPHWTDILVNPHHIKWAYAIVVNERRLTQIMFIDKSELVIDMTLEQLHTTMGAMS